MKSILKFILLATSLFLAIEACDENHDDFATLRENHVDPYNPYEMNPFLIPYFYGKPPSSRIPASANYEGRTTSNKLNFFNSFKNAYPKNQVEDDAESRFIFGKFGASLLNAGLFNNRFGNNVGNGGGFFRPFSGAGNLLPVLPVTRNPDFPGLVSNFETCTSLSQEDGICAPGAACSLFGGRPSGSCGLKGVCCVNAVTKCGSTITLNNTYWQSPVTATSSCSLTLRLDQGLFEQPKAISQVRLDFNAFSIGQPNAEGVCATDVFQVTGATNRVPRICGDNSGQHMYLNLPSASARSTGSLSNEITLSFNFGALSTSARNWNIKISMLPAGSSYLAPAECLQYFTSSSGTVSSFNWRDVAGTATRQLANQDYNICFRTELINSQNVQLQQRASSMCFSPCTVTTGQLPFSLSVPYQAAVIDPVTGVITPGVAAAGFSQILPSNCNNDYLVIPGGFDPATVAVGAIGNVLDRFCGERFTTAIGSNIQSSVCTTASPFRILYRTNGDETITITPDTPGAGNRGFCLNFQERLV